MTRLRMLRLLVASIVLVADLVLGGCTTASTSLQPGTTTGSSPATGTTSPANVCTPAATIDYSAVPATPSSTPGPAAKYVPSVVTARAITSTFEPSDVTNHFQVGDTVYVAWSVRGIPQGEQHTVAVHWLLQGSDVPDPQSRSCAPVTVRNASRTISGESNGYFGLTYGYPGVGTAAVSFDATLAQTVTFGIYR
jgi:hypothetical protein